jgi:hypothetical protein
VLYGKGLPKPAFAALWPNKIGLYSLYYLHINGETGSVRMACVHIFEMTNAGADEGS